MITAISGLMCTVIVFFMIKAVFALEERKFINILREIEEAETAYNQARVAVDKACNEAHEREDK